MTTPKAKGKKRLRIECAGDIHIGDMTDNPLSEITFDDKGRWKKLGKKLLKAGVFRGPDEFAERYYPKLYTTLEAAAYLGLSLKTIQGQCKRGVIKAKKFGRDYQIEKGELDRYKAENMK